METTHIAIKPVCISIGVVIFLEICAGQLTSLGFMQTFAALGMIRFFESVLLLLIFSTDGNYPHTIGLGLDRIYQGLIKGLLWSVGFGFVVLLSAIAIYLWGLNPLTFFRSGFAFDGFMDLILKFTVICLISPVAEEIFFRGVIYGFCRQWGIIFALLTASFCFVSIHSAWGFAQVAGAVLFAVAYEIEGSLMTPITIHILGNAAIFMLCLT